MKNVLTYIAIVIGVLLLASVIVSREVKEDATYEAEMSTQRDWTK